jgi:hypothetical protein
MPRTVFSGRIVANPDPECLTISPHLMHSTPDAVPVGSKVGFSPSEPLRAYG